MITKNSLISTNELDRIINNLDIKKAPGLDCIISNKLIKYLKPALINVLHFFFNLRINFGIHPAHWKIAKVIMLHNCESRRFGRKLQAFQSYSGFCKFSEKAVGDNLSNWEKDNKKFNKQQNGFRKNWYTNDNLFKLFETIKLWFCKEGGLQEYFLTPRKLFTNYGMTIFSLN